MERTDKNIVKKAVFIRPDDAHKGNCGSLLSICGSYGMAGAGIMAGRSALRSGLGLLRFALPESIYAICAQNLLESVFLPLDETADGKIAKSNIDLLLKQAESSTAVLIGCGLSVCDDTKEIVEVFIENCTKPMVLDADALNCISNNTEILKKSKAPVIITPHPAEMARLINTTAKLVNAEREKVTTDFAKTYGVVCVLKGAGTIIADKNGRTMLNTTGNSGMATGGSGDVLAGIISSILAQGGKAFDSACAGVYIHGLAGDISAEELGKISMLPTDIIDSIPLAFKKCGLD